MTRHGTHLAKDAEAAWGLSTEPMIEKPMPEEREEWALLQRQQGMPGTRPHFRAIEEIYTVQLEHPKGAMDSPHHLQLIKMGLYGLLEVTRTGAQER